MLLAGSNVCITLTPGLNRTKNTSTNEEAHFDAAQELYKSSSQPTSKGPKHFQLMNCYHVLKHNEKFLKLYKHTPQKRLAAEIPSSDTPLKKISYSKKSFTDYESLDGTLTNSTEKVDADSSKNNEWIASILNENGGISPDCIV